MSRVLSAIDKLAMGGTARFYLSPDFTITRQPERWASGFAYGGVLDIITSRQIVFPETRPNTCGMCVGRLCRRISQDAFVRRLLDVRSKCPGLEWDYGRRNHFVNVYESAESGSQVFVIHGCLSRQKADTKESPGLYIDRSEYWSQKALTIDTPVGPLAVLIDEDADEFWRNYQKCEQESKRSRLQLADELFGSFELITNEAHEGMSRRDQYVSGCYCARTTSSIFPVLTTVSSPGYLVSARPHARESLPRHSIGIVPHGTGYDLPISLENVEVTCSPTGDVIFKVQTSHPTGVSTELYRNLSHMPFNYRSPELVGQWSDEGIFEVRERLLPSVFVKF